MPAEDYWYFEQASKIQYHLNLDNEVGRVV